MTKYTVEEAFSDIGAGISATLIAICNQLIATGALNEAQLERDLEIVIKNSEAAGKMQELGLAIPGLLLASLRHRNGTSLQ